MADQRRERIWKANVKVLGTGYSTNNKPYAELQEEGSTTERNYKWNYSRDYKGPKLDDADRGKTLSMTLKITPMEQGRGYFHDIMEIHGPAEAAKPAAPGSTETAQKQPYGTPTQRDEVERASIEHQTAAQRALERAEILAQLTMAYMQMPGEIASPEQKKKAFELAAFGLETPQILADAKQWFLFNHEGKDPIASRVSALANISRGKDGPMELSTADKAFDQLPAAAGSITAPVPTPIRQEGGAGGDIQMRAQPDLTAPQRVDALRDLGIANMAEAETHLGVRWTGWLQEKRTYREAFAKIAMKLGKKWPA